MLNKNQDRVMQILSDLSHKSDCKYASIENDIDRIRERMEYNILSFNETHEHGDIDTEYDWQL